VTWLIVLLAVVVVVVGGALATTRMRSVSLKQRFGPEYHRILDQEGDRRSAEAALRELAKQRDALEISELTPEAHARYSEQWYIVQARFVDDPHHTLAEAAELVARVMHERGYPVDGSDDCSNYVSVDYPEFATDYLMAGHPRRRAARVHRRPASGDPELPLVVRRAAGQPRRLC
jgi:hypothetical protein